VINLLLIGSGAWGKNYIKTCSDFSMLNLIVANRDNWKSLVDKNPFGVIIATPPNTHVDIALYCLERKIPTLIEKPLALSLEDALRLKPYSKDILVDYIHLFSDTHANIKKLIALSEITSIRTCGVGPVKRSYSNLYDYGVHDLSIILDLMKRMPNGISFDRIITEDRDFHNINLDYGEVDVSCRVGVDLKKVRTITIMSREFHFHYNNLNAPATKNTPLHNVVSVFMDYLINGNRDSRMGIDLSLNILNLLSKCNT
jgi:predicted dehydrogenase